MFNINVIHVKLYFGGALLGRVLAVFGDADGRLQGVALLQQALNGFQPLKVVNGETAESSVAKWPELRGNHMQDIHPIVELTK